MTSEYRGSAEFQEWWNSHFDPSETGRTRMAAAHAFEAGMARERKRFADEHVVRAVMDDLKSNGPIAERLKEMFETSIGASLS